MCCNLDDILSILYNSVQICSFYEKQIVDVYAEIVLNNIVLEHFVLDLLV